METAPKVPIYTFDEHNEAFFFWHKAKREGFIEGPLDLLHIDAHDDMDRSDRFAQSVYFPDGSGHGDYLQYYHAFAETDLNNGNFIRPAVLNKLIRNIYFVSPSWRKFKPRRRRMNICSVFGEGKILKHNLTINRNTDPRALKAYPDFTRFNYSLLPIDKVPRNRKVILDIDLDFFACRDSIQNHLGYRLEVTKEQFAAKDDFLRDRTLRFSLVAFDFTEEDGRHFVQVSLRRVKDVSHLPSRQEIVAEIGTLVSALVAKKVKPAVVTISRSCVSGYCPREYAGFIEEELKLALGELNGIGHGTTKR
ncbi:MAG: UPF0489 family protein [Terriglobia bacterium]